MPLSPGTRLGPYEIVAPIGAGGMGEVYRARDTRLERDVAVKVLPSHLAEDPDLRQRFEREARAVAALTHPNILALHDIGVESGIAYSVAELLEGETLRARLESGALAPRRAVDFALQIAHGLAAAHAKGVVHRDLKPENIFITHDARAKILDFGLAKWTAPDGVDPTRSPTVEVGTLPGVVLGTLGYMSPEQVRGQAVDLRSDIFAFGAILYEMLSGARAFAGPSAADIMSAILREEPLELVRSGRDIPPGLERVVLHCLEKLPDQRFQSARDVAFALEALSGFPGAAAGVSVSAARVVPAGDVAVWRTQWRALLVFGAILGAVLGVAAFFVGLRAGSSSPRTSVVFDVLSYRPQTIFRAAFAPDGKTVVYSAALAGNRPRLYTRSLDYPEPRAFDLEQAQLLSVSTNGEIALLLRPQYIGHRLFEGTLARMPMGGGAPREVLEGVREADWAPDGVELAIIRSQGGKDRLEYPAGNVLCETSGYFSDLRFAPDGRYIAYFQHPIAFDDRGGVAVVEIAAKKVTVLADGYWGEEGLAWVSDGSEILFSAGTSYSSFKIFAVTMAGKNRIALDSAGGLVIHDVARDGRWLVCRDDIWKDLRLRVAGETEDRDLSWLDQSDGAALSADGKLLLFSEQSGQMGVNYAVCMRPTTGGAVTRFGEGWAADLSPDGKWALGVVPTSPNQLMLYPTGAGQSRRIDTDGVTEVTTARWFPDGKRVFLCGSETGRAARGYVLELEGGKRVVLTPEGVPAGFVSPDGTRVVVQTTDNAFEIYPVAGGEPRRVEPGATLKWLAGWSRDGRALLLQSPHDVPGRLERLDLDAGRLEPLLNFAPPDLAGVMRVVVGALRDDGATLAYTAYRRRSTLFVVTGAR